MAKKKKPKSSFTFTRMKKKKLTHEQKSWLGLGAVAAVAAVAYLTIMYQGQLRTQVTQDPDIGPLCSGSGFLDEDSSLEADAESCEAQCEAAGGAYSRTDGGSATEADRTGQVSPSGGAIRPYIRYECFVYTPPLPAPNDVSPVPTPTVASYPGYPYPRSAPTPVISGPVYRTATGTCYVRYSLNTQTTNTCYPAPEGCVQYSTSYSGSGGGGVTWDRQDNYTTTCVYVDDGGFPPI